MNPRHSNQAASQRWWENPNFIATLILVASGIVFFADVLFSSKNYYYRDILNFHYPLRKVLVDSFERGEFPLWNPYVYLGQPMLANPNYMTFYPTNLLHLLFSFNYAFKLHFILHPIAGGLGLYFLTRRFGIRWVAALAGAISYEFSGVVLCFLNLYNLIPAVALMPWAAWAFYGALQEHAWRRTVGFGFLLALELISFEPLIFQCEILLLVATAATWIWEQKNHSTAFRRALVLFAAGALLAGGLAAVQILPTLELLPLSARGSGIGFKMASEWSMHPTDLLNTIVPNLFGNSFTIDASNYWGELYHESTAGYIASFFLGSVTFLLFSLSIFSHRKKLRAAMIVVFGISVILGLGKFTPAYPWLYHHVPFFDLGRYPSKYFLLSSLIVSILAALGLEAVMSVGTKKKFVLTIDRVCMAWALLGACVLGLALYWMANPGQPESLIREATMPALAVTKNFPAITASFTNSIRTTGTFLLLGCLLVVGGRQMKRIAALGVLLILLMYFELVPANIGLAPLISDANMSFVSEINLYMLQKGLPELGRAVSPNIMTPIQSAFKLNAPNRSLAWTVLFYRRSGLNLDGIRSGIHYSIDRSIDHLNTRETEALLQSCLDLPLKERLSLLANLNSSMIMSLEQLPDPRVELLRRFDTHSSFDCYLYRLKNALPRAYFATHVIRVASADEARSRLLRARTELQHSVILESEARPLLPRSAEGERVRIVRYENNRVLCQVQTDSDGYLVLLDSFYPGWRATVDGQETAILRANYAFRAVYVPVGEHSIEFRFTPRTFYAGLTLTLLTSLIAIVPGLWMWIRGGHQSLICKE